MDKKTFKHIVMGITLAAGTTGLASCGNNNENKDDNTKPQTEQTNYKIGNALLDDINYPTVKTASKENERDSILTGVEADIITDHHGSKFKYKNPIYSVKGKSDPRKAKVGINVADDVKSATLEFSYDERTPEDSIREEKEEKEFLKELSEHKDAGIKKTADEGESRRNEYAAAVSNGSNEYKIYHERVEFKDDTITFNFSDQNEANPNGERISAKQSKPEKKEFPKGLISKDAFINALLEQNGKRGGRK